MGCILVLLSFNFEDTNILSMHVYILYFTISATYEDMGIPTHKYVHVAFIGVQM
jgi:hypothetical protein